MFLFRLALRLGRTVGELLDSLSSAELTEWMAFNEMQPIGDERADINQAIQTATLVRMKVKKGTKVEPRDFLPGWSSHGEDKPTASEIDRELLDGLLNAGRNVVRKKG